MNAEVSGFDADVSRVVFQLSEDGEKSRATSNQEIDSVDA
jgi:hypothetical protein